MLFKLLLYCFESLSAYPLWEKATAVAQHDTAFSTHKPRRLFLKYVVLFLFCAVLLLNQILFLAIGEPHKEH